jgi:hypothetical protein
MIITVIIRIEDRIFIILIILFPPITIISNCLIIEIVFVNQMIVGFVTIKLNFIIIIVLF